MPNFREPTTARFIYLTANGDIDVQMPIIGAMLDGSNKVAISTDNTCKTLRVLQEFFGVAVFSPNPSLESELNSYKQKLEFDLTLIASLGEITPRVKEIQERKQKRLTQIMAWQKFLHEVASTPEIATHINNGAGYSPSIKAIIEDHIYSMVLRPAKVDTIRSQLTPVFNMENAPSFYQMLVSELNRIPPKENKKDLLVVEALKSLKNVKPPISDEGLEQIKKALSTQLFPLYEISDSNFFSSYFDNSSKKQQEITLDYLKLLTVVDDQTTVEECARDLISLCGNALPKETDHLFSISEKTPESLEKLNLTIQFFLGQLNITCISWEKTTADFAVLLENNNGLASGLINTITNCLAKGKLVEPALLAYINANHKAFNLNAPLTPKEQETFIPLFKDLYTIITKAGEFDEFTVLTDNNRGVCAHHQAAVVVPFRELANRLNIKLDNSLLFPTPPHSSMVLDNENADKIAKEQFDQEIDHMKLIHNALQAKPPNLEFIAQLLLSETTIANKAQFLFRQLSEDDINSIRSNPFWPQLRFCVTSKLAGNDITNFEKHFKCDDISFPLTEKMIYALQANLIKNRDPKDWISNDDLYTSGGLERLLNNNGIKANKVPNYPSVHGITTIGSTAEQIAAIEEIVKNNDNQIFIDTAMARAIYIAANEAAGTSKWDIVNGQKLNNKKIEGKIPAKIKRAFELLNIHFGAEDSCSFPNNGQTPGFVFKTSPRIQQEILQLAAARPQLLLTEKMIAAFENYVKRLPRQEVLDSGIEQIAEENVIARVTCLLNLIGYTTKNIGLSDVNPQEVWVEVHEEVKNLYEWIAENEGNVTFDDYLKSGLGGRGSRGAGYACAHLSSQKLERNLAVAERPSGRISGNGGGLDIVPPEPEKTTSTPEEIAEKLTTLREKVALLGEYSAKLKATTNTKKAQAKGQFLENLVVCLNKHCADFERDYAQQPDIGVWNKFNNDFNNTLDANKKQIRQYSSNLKPVLAIISSIIVAFTGLGTLIMIALFVKAKQQDSVLTINKACLFGKNRTEQIVDEVKEATKELDQVIVHTPSRKG